MPNVFQVFPNDALRHMLGEFLQQQLDASVIRERKRVKSHTLSPIKGAQRPYRGSQAIGRLWDEHQSHPFHLSRETDGA
jgi:hypothetical protein